MKKIDRLSALMARFELIVSPCDPAAANFLVLADVGSAVPSVVLLAPSGGASEFDSCQHVPLFGAKFQWGEPNNPFLAALPKQIKQRLVGNAELMILVELLLGEFRAQRCGSASVLNRLGEILIVKLLRVEIEQDVVRPGLLGGLADKRLSRAIVAMHEQPGHPWRNDSLAQIAGLSVSRFAELFRQAVAETPAAYLRKWRLVLAKQDIERGDRLQKVATRYGYGSSEALNHAFQKHYGNSPIRFRKL